MRAAALAALKQLCADARGWCGLLPDDDEDEEDEDGSSGVADAGWLDALTSVVIPGLRRGLKQSTDTVKKGFVSLLAHVVSTLGVPAWTLNHALTDSGHGHGAGAGAAARAAGSLAAAQVTRALLTHHLLPWARSLTQPSPSTRLPLIPSNSQAAWRQLADVTHGDLAALQVRRALFRHLSRPLSIPI